MSLDRFDLLEDHHEIAPNLFLGSMPSNIDRFDFVMALNGRPTYYIPLGKMVIACPFDDVEDPKVIKPEKFYDLARLVNTYKAKGRVLVHCAAGINRSAMIVALSLILEGMTPADAVARIHEKRSNLCLSNKVFKDWLLSLADRPAV